MQRSLLPRMCSTRKVRNFSAYLPQRSIPEIPDNAPTMQENTEWLEKLTSNKLKEEDQHEFTYKITEKSDLEDPRQNKDYMVIRSLKTKTSDHIVKKPTDDDPYFTLSVAATDYFIASSPFSSLSSKRRPKAESIQPFSDLRVVKLKSGKGGNGDVSFFRDAGITNGPPDGGDGGYGGDVYVMAVNELSSLHNIRSKYVAGNGTNGKNGQLDGKKGDSIYITVPVGTNIKWCPDPKEIRSLLKQDYEQKVFHIKATSGNTLSFLPKLIQFFRQSYEIGSGWIFKDKGEEYHREREYFNTLNEKVKIFDANITHEELINDTFPIKGIDLEKPTTEPVLLLKGGKGGMGNMHFLTADIRNPRFAKQGRNGLEHHFIFELKLLADLGLVGLPNAGKSTLLRSISNARPKVGHWKFTTLQPTIGTIPLRIDQPPFTVADIPGIVRGAKDNRGMGLNFLRHIERSGGIVFVVSLGSKNPIEDLEILMEELGQNRISGKNILIVATKADLEDSYENFRVLRDFADEKKWKIVPCCAKNKENVEKVIELMAECSGRIDYN